MSEKNYFHIMLLMSKLLLTPILRNCSQGIVMDITCDICQYSM
jgi:hypothetical protein